MESLKDEEPGAAPVDLSQQVDDLGDVQWAIDVVQTNAQQFNSPPNIPNLSMYCYHHFYLLSSVYMYIYCFL